MHSPVAYQITLALLCAVYYGRHSFFFYFIHSLGGIPVANLHAAFLPGYLKQHVTFETAYS